MSKALNWQERLKTLEHWFNQLLACRQLGWKGINWESIPKKPGVYLIFEGDHCIYVGESGRGNATLRSRLRIHNRGNTSSNTFNKKLCKIRGIKSKQDRVKFIENRCYFNFLAFEGEYKERLNLEHFAIAVLNSELND